MKGDYFSGELSLLIGNYCLPFDLFNFSLTSAAYSFTCSLVMITPSFSYAHKSPKFFSSVKIVVSGSSRRMGSLISNTSSDVFLCLYFEGS